MGQKRCRRGDACQIIIWISIYKELQYHQSVMAGGIFIPIFDVATEEVRLWHVRVKGKAERKEREDDGISQVDQAEILPAQLQKTLEPRIRTVWRICAAVREVRKGD